MKNYIDRISRSIILFWILFWSLVLAGSVYLYFLNKRDRLEKQIDQTEKQISKEGKIFDKLDLQWTFLTSSERIKQLSQLLLPEEQSITPEDMYSIDNIKSADSVQAVSVGDVSYNIYNTGN